MPRMNEYNPKIFIIFILFKPVYLKTRSSFLSIRDIPINCRFAILVARRVYRQIGNNILSKRNIENYNKSGKIYVSSIGKFFQTILSIFDFFILLIIFKKKLLLKKYMYMRLLEMKKVRKCQNLKAM